MELWTALPAALLVIAAGHDLAARIIPNWICAALAVLALIRLAATQDAMTAAGSLLIAAALFAAGVGLFGAGAMGGGDVKLAGAVGLWLTTGSVAVFLMVMSLTGAGLAVMMVALKFGGAVLGGSAGSAALRAARRAPVPYGVAIAAGGIAAIAGGAAWA